MKCRYPLITISLFLLLAFACQQAQARTIAFQRGEGIWASGAGGWDQRFVCAGYDPAISPDGRQIAFTRYEYSGKNLNRHIALCEVDSGEVTMLGTVPGTTSFGPAWSLAGDAIAFTVYAGGAWGVGVVRPDGGGYRLLTEGLGVDLYSPMWNGDGRIVCHGGGQIYTLDPRGGAAHKEPCEKIAGGYAVTGATAFAFSQDGRRLLFGASVDGESIRGLNEPPDAVFVHRMSSGVTARVTPAGLCALYPSWFSDGRILFSGFGEGDIPPAGGGAIGTRVYTVDVTGKNMKALIEDATDPSISAE